MIPRIKGESSPLTPHPHLCQLCIACGSITVEPLSDMLASLSWTCPCAGVKGKGPELIFQILPCAKYGSTFFLKKLTPFIVTIILKSRSFNTHFTDRHIEAWTAYQGPTALE